MLNMGWVDFAKSDRDIVMSVLRQLSEPGAVDELGIGTIRDAFSDILFPGISTIQTRAKYLFLIPYICLELERNGKLLPQEFITALEQNELDLIDTLDVNGAEGVIGSRSRQTLRRKPSSIYWSALRTYGIFSEAATLSEYATLSWAKHNTALLHKTSGRRKSDNDDDAADDSDVGKAGASFWRIPIPVQGWRESVTIDLTNAEAVFLKEKIVSTPKTKDSLFALILRKNRHDFTEFTDFDEIDSLQGIMPAKMQSDYTLARDFSRFIYGAQVRYNVIYSERRNAVANKLWEDYINRRPKLNLNEIMARFKPKASVMRFLKQFGTSLGDSDALDALIIRREKELKSFSRSKLANKEVYQYNDNNVNMSPLTYRLSYVQRIVQDIFDGVGRDA